MSVEPKHDWSKTVAESNGRIIFLPKEFKKDMESLNKKREALNAKFNGIAKDEIELQTESQAIYLALRKHLEKNGYPDIWTKDIGMNLDARRDGLEVIQITEQQGRTL